MNRVLVVDDEEDVRASVRGVLEKFQFDVECASDAETAMSLIERNEPDLVILDILLPGTSGKDFCRELRRDCEVPVIFLSGLSSDVDRIVGLELGADDYLTKPFHPGELLARVRAVLRRTGGARTAVASKDPADESTLEYGAVSLDLARHEAFVNGEGVELTHKEFLLLKTLMRRPRHVCTRDDLIVGAYGQTTYVSYRTINSHINRMRRKFEEVGINPIEAVWAVGYRMAAIDALQPQG